MTQTWFLSISVNRQIKLWSINKCVIDNLRFILVSTFESFSSRQWLHATSLCSSLTKETYMSWPAFITNSSNAELIRTKGGKKAENHRYSSKSYLLNHMRIHWVVSRKTRATSYIIPRQYCLGDVHIRPTLP